MTQSGTPIRGTREWAVATVDCATGCPHDCRYCYARWAAVEKLRTVTPAAWPVCRVDRKAVERRQPRYPGQVMFPANHDIVPEILEECLEVIGNLLAAGNRVLLVSKPHLACISRICAAFGRERQRLLFRFTITARSRKLLDFWEPGAPGYEERKSCLEYAFTRGFATSVSVEPILDSADVVPMVLELMPFVSHSIWLGKMNRIEVRVTQQGEEARRRVREVLDGQRDEKIFEIHRQLADEPLVRWKESIKEVVGLALPNEAGLDI